MTKLHQPVLLAEALENLVIKEDGIYLDATFGRGGHAKAILDKLGSQGRLLAVDKDPEAIATGDSWTDPRFTIWHGSFAECTSYLEEQAVLGKVDGILMDLGVSSPQLDNAERGFSFLRDGPLDMRMDPSHGIDAATWINSASESDIAAVIKSYGEERYARRITRAIVNARQQERITRTGRLAKIIKEAHPKWEEGKHPATRSFQGIRIFINRELDDLKDGLHMSLQALKIGGRLVVISFHSLEDRIVKQFIQQQERGGELLPDLPLTEAQIVRQLKRVGRMIKPAAEEMAVNPRARSARLRVAEKSA